MHHSGLPRGHEVVFGGALDFGAEGVMATGLDSTYQWRKRPGACLKLKTTAWRDQSKRSRVS